MERVFKIEWPNDAGPMWLNQDNLMRCLRAVCEYTTFTVTDVTNRPEECTIEGADLCYGEPLTYGPRRSRKALPRGSWARRLFRWFGCSTGLYHLRCEWKDDGIRCVDCGHFKSKAKHMADLHAGGGW